MSARRQARAGDVAEVVTEAGGIPRSLLIGRCLEVWADPADGFPQHSARIRFNRVRSWWLRTANVPDREGWQLIPAGGAPWSVEYLTYRGQAERADRSVRELVDERLARGGCTADDLTALRADVEQLWAYALEPPDGDLARRQAGRKAQSARSWLAPRALDTPSLP